MTKKAKQGARLPKRSRARVRKPPPEKIGVSIGPASPSSEWLALMQQKPTEVGPGLWRDVPPPSNDDVGRPESATRLSTSGAPSSGGYGAPVWIVDGVCDGCLEKITQPRDHCWWCAWWDTEEGKRVSPF